MLLNSSSFLSSFILYTVNVVDGENLTISKVSRLHMGAYLCIASNGVPPSISKRVMLMVQCKYFYSFIIVISSVSLTLVNIMQSQVFRSRSCVNCGIDQRRQNIPLQRLRVNVKSCDCSSSSALNR